MTQPWRRATSGKRRSAAQLAAFAAIRTLGPEANRRAAQQRAEHPPNASKHSLSLSSPSHSENPGPSSTINPAAPRGPPLSPRKTRSYNRVSGATETTVTSPEVAERQSSAVGKENDSALATPSPPSSPSKHRRLYSMSSYYKLSGQLTDARRKIHNLQRQNKRAKASLASCKSSKTTHSGKHTNQP